MMSVAVLAISALPIQAQTKCNLKRLEKFLSKRAFELSADQKIDLYADKLVRYFGRRNVSNRSVYRSMRTWERRWPERIYKYMRTTDYEKTEEGDACKVTFDYRFLAYSPRRDKISAGLGTTTLVLADLDGEGLFQIIGEFGDVKCRGLTKFARSRC